MNNLFSHVVIVGTSQGLGASLVNCFFQKSSCKIIGISHTAKELTKIRTEILKSDRYLHYHLQIGTQNFVQKLKLIAESLNTDSNSTNYICVIFNSACIVADLKVNMQKSAIDWPVFHQIHQIGVIGLNSVLEGFADYFAKHRGVFVGISSFSAYFPGIDPLKIAYPASKAYLDLLLEALRILWHQRVHVITIHLGRISAKEQRGIASLSSTNYSAASNYIFKVIMKAQKGAVYDYPFIYKLLYRYLFALLSSNARRYFLCKIKQIAYKS
ncbi:MAG: SDR family NAD(P)-dependent oxidoreductase [Oligoflexia bacterium]|nr:SDR family NAD(P)-dependent oxidoreductase [Oligoflexia bacterium]